MKNILAFAIYTVALFTGCSKDENTEKTTTQTFFVNVHSQLYEDAKEDIASPVSVYLFEDSGKSIDKDKSKVSIADNSTVTFTDGSTVKPTHTSASTNGINTFENIPNGKYTLWAVYKFYAHFWVSSKNIVVNDDYRAKTEKKVFLHKDTPDFIYTYQDWDAKW